MATREAAQIERIGKAVRDYLARNKAGAGINLSKSLEIDAIKVTSDGYRLELGNLVRGGGSLFLYLDAFSGERRLWYGFSSKKSQQIESLLSIMLEFTKKKPIRLDDSDYTVNKGKERARRVLPCDRVIYESYLDGGRIEFCGIYSAHTIPIHSSDFRAFSIAIADFFLNVCRAYLAQHETTDGGHSTRNSNNNKEVEQQAVRVAKSWLEEHHPDCTIRSRESGICGYDLLVQSTDGTDKLHVEVKGVTQSSPHFFLTSTEDLARRSDRKWRMLIVTKALSSSPVVRIYKSDELESEFDFIPDRYHCHPKR